MVAVVVEPHSVVVEVAAHFQDCSLSTLFLILPQLSISGNAKVFESPLVVVEALAFVMRSEKAELSSVTVEQLLSKSVAAVAVALILSFDYEAWPTAVPVPTSD